MKSPYKRAQKQQRYPQWSSAIVFSLLLAFVGALLGFLLFARNAPLAMNDPAALQRVVSQAAESGQINPAAAYYLRPTTARPRQWQAIRTALSSAGHQPVVIPAADVNGWLQAVISPPPPSVETPMLGFATRQMQMAIPAENQLQWSVSGDAFLFGQMYPVLFVFDNALRADAVVIDRLRINAAPVPAIPGLRQWIARSMVQLLGESNDLTIAQSAYQRAVSTQIDAAANAITLHFADGL
jgi:hypothetical protein